MIVQKVAARDLGSTSGPTDTGRDPSVVDTPQSDEILLGTPCLRPCRKSCLAPLTSDTQLSGFSRQGLEQGEFSLSRSLAPAGDSSTLTCVLAEQDEPSRGNMGTPEGMRHPPAGSLLVSFPSQLLALLAD